MVNKLGLGQEMGVLKDLWQSGCARGVWVDGVCGGWLGFDQWAGVQTALETG